MIGTLNWFVAKMEKKHKKHLDLLFNMARDVAPVRSAKIASSIVIKNKIIAFGTNKYKTHPFQASYGVNKDSICLHAEIDVIKNALKRVDVDDLKRSTLYIARVKKEMVSPGQCNEVWGIVKPCDGCMKAIINFGIKKVFYTTDINNKYEKL